MKRHNEIELRKWCVEQALKMGLAGFAEKTLTGEAENIYNWVNASQDTRRAAAEAGFWGSRIERYIHIPLD